MAAVSLQDGCVISGGQGRIREVASCSPSTNLPVLFPNSSQAAHRRSLSPKQWERSRRKRSQPLGRTVSTPRVSTKFSGLPEPGASCRQLRNGWSPARSSWTGPTKGGEGPRRDRQGHCPEKDSRGGGGRGGAKTRSNPGRCGSPSTSVNIAESDPQKLEGWLSDRNCDLRNAIEFGNPGLVGQIGHLIGQGTRQLERVHEGKTHIWNLAGIKPEICDVLQRAAEVAKPGARVWRGSEVPTEEQGIKVLGASVGHRDFVRKHLERILEQHEVLLNGIPRVPDVQSAWLLLLHCASVRANYQLRVECVLEFARAHDENMWRRLCTILEVPTTACSRNARDLSSLPLSLGGLGLRSATRTRVSAYWASWADTLPMVQSRHPQIADIMCISLKG